MQRVSIDFHVGMMIGSLLVLVFVEVSRLTVRKAVLSVLIGVAIFVVWFITQHHGGAIWAIITE